MTERGLDINCDLASQGSPATGNIFSGAMKALKDLVSRRHAAQPLLAQRDVEYLAGPRSGCINLATEVQTDATITGYTDGVRSGGNFAGREKWQQLGLSQGYISGARGGSGEIKR